MPSSRVRIVPNRSYETGNSIVHEETGFMKQTGGPEDMLVQQGSYSYKDDDGNVFTVRYTADDQGFRAHGDHFPTPPPIPLEIQRGLEIIYEQIRLDAERRLEEKKYGDEDDNGLEGGYSSNVEHRTPYSSRNNKDLRMTHFKTEYPSNGENQLYFNKNKVEPEQPVYSKYSISTLDPRSVQQTSNTYQQEPQLNLGEVHNFPNEHMEDY